MDIERFMDKTMLVPAIVLDTVAEELLRYLYPRFQIDFGTARLEALLRFLKSEDMTGTIEQRTLAVYESNEKFRLKLLTQDPRPFYYAFMRHWVSAEIQKNFPDIFSKLPAGFKVGEPIENVNQI
ncbi:MAG: hypothetical protein ACLQF0_06825 [Dissulfurispiraceae bacterium]